MNSRMVCDKTSDMIPLVSRYQGIKVSRYQGINEYQGVGQLDFARSLAG